ncbi:leukocidin family pore-forming toxin [Photobacterium damselae]|uniref:leukocidin family pore-forming toxin n=1 Tax=Photobacterium damselae TaxID=38293 RepID=UPI000D077C4A|nr:leukocidin family pore-forming toxin [Photobacterium damselae]AWK82243.1 hemolysin [Photobacterium damselae]PSB78306.1 hemolysin [Photobacterium damselae subsp. damselae]
MKIRKLYSCILLGLSSLSASAIADVDNYSTGADAISILSSVQNPDRIVYVNMKQEEISTYNRILEDIIYNDKQYIFDLSFENNEEKEKLQKKFKDLMGVKFDSNFIVVTGYKNQLMYTPIADANDRMVSVLDHEARSNDISKYPMALALRSGNATSDQSISLPHVSFYLNVNKEITDQECTFRNSLLWDRGSRSFCKNGNISLIYQVILERSLSFGTNGVATPDAKIVRISLDDNTTGAGIHLNDTLTQKYYWANYQVVSGWAREWSASAIAQDYLFDISTSNKKAQILKTFPRENINSNYNINESSGFTIGVTGGAEVSKDGPKASLQANASYSQSKSLSFNTQDYRVEKNSTSAQNVSFRWAREQYPDSESLLDKWTNPVWSEGYPANLKKVQPLSYASFVPKLDVIYKASPNETGKTQFTIDSSVNIMPLYNRSWFYFYGIGAHQTYYGVDDQPLRRVNKAISFTVDWEHPVFTGGTPVNLQLASFNNKCIDIQNNNKVMTAECDINSKSQSFIYDQYNRYVSATNTKLCLDGESLSELQSCSLKLTQKWLWDGDRLKNSFEDKYLTVDSDTLSLETSLPNKQKLNSSYTRVFDPSTINQ